MHHFILKSGHTLKGKHHKIYLNSPTSLSEEKLCTIIRQPAIHNPEQK